MENGIISVLEDKLDEQIELVDNLYRKYDKSILINNDLTNCFQFPTMKREFYTEDIQKDDESKTSRVREEFRGL